MRLVTGAERWERFVWNVTDQPRLHAHPARVDARRWQHTAVDRRLVAHRAPDLHPGARRSARRCSRSTSRCSALADGHRHAGARRRAARRHRLDERSGAGLPRPERRARAAAGLAGGAAGEDAARSRRRASTSAPRRHAAARTATSTTSTTPGRRRGAGPACLPAGQRPAGALGRARATSSSWRPASAWATISSPPGMPGAATRRAASGCSSSRSNAIRRGATTWRGPMPARRWPELAAATAAGLAAAGAQPAPARLRRRPRATAAGAGRRQPMLPALRAGRPTPSTWTASRRRATRRCGSRACSRRWAARPHPAPPPPPGAWRASVRAGLTSAGFEVDAGAGHRRQARDHRGPLRAALRAAAGRRRPRLARCAPRRRRRRRAWPVRPRHGRWPRLGLAVTVFDRHAAAGRRDLGQPAPGCSTAP